MRKFLVTPEMISAGVEVLWGYDPDSDRAGEMSMEETVRRIFLAMIRAADE